MKFKNFINEKYEILSYDKIKIERRGRYTFTIDNYFFTFYIQEDYIDDFKFLTLNFTIKTESSETVSNVDIFKTPRMLIFSYILTCIDYFIKTEKPENFQIYTKDSQRQSLYSKIFKISHSLIPDLLLYKVINKRLDNIRLWYFTKNEKTYEILYNDALENNTLIDDGRESKYLRIQKQRKNENKKKEVSNE